MDRPEARLYGQMAGVDEPPDHLPSCRSPFVSTSKAPQVGDVERLA
jgi:hypothetical protein